MFRELTEDQRRQLIDARQLFDLWREADAFRRHSCRGSMHWRHIRGRDYLYHNVGKAKRSLGPRDARTEQILREFTEQSNRVKERLETLDGRIKAMAPVNRAMGLGRVPSLAARILRRLDVAGLLGRHLFVVGTHALYAYEAAAGVIFESGLTTTADIDLLWDDRRRLTLALVDARAEGVLGLLKKVDHTFEARPGDFRAANDESYYVDLLRPMEKDELRTARMRLGEADDLEAGATTGLEWLINAPKFEQIVIGADGKPLFLSSIDPRVFALHKLWVSQRDDREPLKRRRDHVQARAVAAVAAQFLGLRFDSRDLSAVPHHLVEAAPQLFAAAT
jgi:hypothetical protein